MKQIFFFTSVLCFLAFPLKGTAQGSDAAVPIGQILIGAKAGGSLGQFTQPGTVFTGNIGAFGRYQAIPFLQAQVDLGYDAFGGARTDLKRQLNYIPDNIDTPTGLVTRLEYLHRQVFFHTVKGQLSGRFTLPELNGAPVQPQLIVGLNAAYIFGARENRDQYITYDDGSSVILSNDWEVVSNDYAKLNLGVHFGFGMDFGLPNGETFSLELVYDRGFTDLNSVQFGQPRNIQVLRSHRFGVSLSYTFLNF